MNKSDKRRVMNSVIGDLTTATGVDVRIVQSVVQEVLDKLEEYKDMDVVQWSLSLHKSGVGPLRNFFDPESTPEDMVYHLNQDYVSPNEVAWDWHLIDENDMSVVFRMNNWRIEYDNEHKKWVAIEEEL